MDERRVIHRDGWRLARRRAATLLATLLAVTGSLAGAPRPAAAAGAPARLSDQQACAATLARAREQERTGSLLEAKDLLLSCSRAPCADFVRRQCTLQHAKLEADTPTIVFVVTDATGAPRNDVQVRLDGTLLEGPVDGHPVEVDPGFHDFSFIANGHVFATQKIMIVQGQRNRFVTEVVNGAGAGAVDRQRLSDAQPSLSEPAVPPVQSLRPPISTTPVRTARRPGAAGKRPAVTSAQNDAPPPAESEADTAKVGDRAGDKTGDKIGAGDEASPAPGPKGAYRILPWALGGVALGGVAAGALLTTWGRRDNDQLGSCAPSCNADTLRHIRRLYTGADVAFGVGIAALGAAYWIYAIGHATPAAPEGGGDTALRLDLAPARSGGVASVSGRF